MEALEFVFSLEVERVLERTEAWSCHHFARLTLLLIVFRELCAGRLAMSLSDMVLELVADL